MSARRDTGKALVTGGPAHRTKGDTDARRSEERQHAYDLRLRGRTIRQIADDMGCSTAKVHTLLREELKIREDPLREQLIQFELDRLDGYQQACMYVLDNPGTAVVVPQPGPPDDDGHPTVEMVTHVIVDDRKILGAIDRLVRISESRRKLLGMDAPVKTQVDIVETTQEDLELQELLREAKARAAAAADKIKNGGA